MNKKTTFVALCLAMSLGSWAQTKQGGVADSCLKGPLQCHRCQQHR